MKPVSCEFIQVGGPPSDWDISRYATDVSANIGTLPGNSTIHPPTMVPRGRSHNGKVVGHPSCYRLLLGVIDAARNDPEREAAFQHDHPQRSFTRQQAAVGIARPAVESVRDYGIRQQRVTLSTQEQAARLAEEASTLSLRDLKDLGNRVDFAPTEVWQTGPRTGAHIPLVNDEVLAQLATSGSAQTTGIAGSSATPLLSPPTLAKPSQKSHKGQKYLNMVAKRAIKSAKGKPESIRSHFNRANKVVRESLNAVHVTDST